MSKTALEHERLVSNGHLSDSLAVASGQLNLAYELNQGEIQFWKRQVHRSLAKLKKYRQNQEGRDIRISFSGFWESFDPNRNEILNLLKETCSEHSSNIAVSSTAPDIMISSCFGGIHKEHSKCTQLLYLGENVRPQYRSFDFSISHDVDSYCGRNIYLPLWMVRSTRYGISGAGYDPYDEESLFGRLVDWESRTGAVYLGNNMTPSRAALFRYLESLGINVDCYGSQTRPIESKRKLYQKYLFSICFENSITPGYNTEKLVDGYIYGTIPIYMGGDSGDLFNKRAYMNIDASRPVYPQLEIMLRQVDEYKKNVPLVRREEYERVLASAKSSLWLRILKPHTLMTETLKDLASPESG